jgi:hypothetical protein
LLRSKNAGLFQRGFSIMSVTKELSAQRRSGWRHRDATDAASRQLCRIWGEMQQLGVRMSAPAHRFDAFGHSPLP